MGPKAKRGRTPRRGQAARRGQSARQRQRAPVVNLDGASSSESEHQSPVKTREKPRGKPEHVLHITLSPDKMSRGIMSDSSDSDCGSDCMSAPQPPAPRVPCLLNTTGSDNSDDIFDINYSAHNYQALKGAYKELIVKGGEQSKAPPAKEDHLPYTRDSDDECYIEEATSTPKRKENISPPSPTLFEIDKQVQKEESRQKTKKRRRRKNKEDETVRQQQELSKRQHITINESLNLSSDVIISEDEDVNPEMKVCIKWGSESFRLPIRKLQKFSHLYKELAQKYGVSEDRIVLNLKDKIVSPALSPGDLGVTIADIIEGGIGSLESCTRGQLPVQQTVIQDPDSISLRIQNSNKKGSVHISISLKEKMSVLMHKYAEEKQHKLDKLRFMFDGEQLNPHSTPSSLDLEGGECIDVYELT